MSNLIKVVIGRFFGHHDTTKLQQPETAPSIEEILNIWVFEGVRLSPAATIEQIHSAEELLLFQFPPDFKKFYLHQNGFIDGDMEKNYFSIWPLDRIIDEYTRQADKSFIVFADFLIRAHHICFIKGKSGIFKNSNSTMEPVAKNFTELLSLIHSDAKILY